MLCIECGAAAVKAQIQADLEQLAVEKVWEEDQGDFEEFCVTLLSSLVQEKIWRPWCNETIVGFTYGEDPRDFLRTATRINSYRLVKKLWSEYWRGEELSQQISCPK